MSDSKTMNNFRKNQASALIILSLMMLLLIPVLVLTGFLDYTNFTVCILFAHILKKQCFYYEVLSILEEVEKQEKESE